MSLADSRRTRRSTILTEPAAKYDNFSILMHWLTAALILVLWIVAQVIDDFPRGAPRMFARSIHISLGIALVFVLIARLAWRASPRRRAPRAMTGALGIAARWVHYSLYVLVIGAVLIGITNVWVRGDTLFGLFTIPQLSPGNDSLKETIAELHEWLGNAVLILAAVHALAALCHAFILKDEVLRRMLPPPL